MLRIINFIHEKFYDWRQERLAKEIQDNFLLDYKYNIFGFRDDVNKFLTHGEQENLKKEVEERWGSD